LAEEEGFPWVLSLHIFRRHSLRNTTLCLSLSRCLLVLDTLRARGPATVPITSSLAERLHLVSHR
jgi:hypothetical protein